MTIDLTAIVTIAITAAVAVMVAVAVAAVLTRAHGRRPSWNLVSVLLPSLPVSLPYATTRPTKKKMALTVRAAPALAPALVAAHSAPLVLRREAMTLKASLSVASIWPVQVLPVLRSLVWLNITAANLVRAKESALKAGCEKPFLFWLPVPVLPLLLASMKKRRLKRKAKTQLVVSDAGLAPDPAAAMDLRSIPTLPVILQA
jgi:hypothetical protein